MSGKTHMTGNYVINSHLPSLFKEHVWGLWLERSPGAPLVPNPRSQPERRTRQGSEWLPPAKGLESDLILPTTPAQPPLHLRLWAPLVAPRSCYASARAFYLLPVLL